MSEPDYFDAKMFDYQKLYEQVVSEAHDGSVFIEIGSCVGCSAAYMAREIRASGKDIAFYCIDPWPHYVIIQCPDHIRKRGESLSKNMATYALFIDNLKRSDLLRFITPIKMESEYGSRLFNKDEIDFIMIDGDHGYPAIRTDIDCWKDKVKDGGIISGHDFLFPGITKAVLETFREEDLYLYSQKDTVFSESVSWMTQRDGDSYKPYMIKGALHAE